MTILLASKSQRRQDLLKQIGVPFELVDCEIDEHIPHHETPAAGVTRLAREKAQAGHQIRDDKPLLAADTIVVVDGQILGKPRDLEDAKRMLRLLSNKTHEVLTAIALIDTNGQYHEACSRSQVRFRSISDQEIMDYWHSGEPQDKAGAYGIQGRGAVFVQHISGSHSGIMGLPLFETANLLQSINDQAGSQK